jgi:hypothetical protein
VSRGVARRITQVQNRHHPEAALQPIGRNQHLFLHFLSMERQYQKDDGGQSSDGTTHEAPPS